MKNLIIILGMLFFTSVFSQTSGKNDIIMTANGELLQVKVTKVTDGTISFNYPGESVVNEIDTNEIEKIVFSSGRTQNFKGSSVPGKTTAAAPQTESEEVTVSKDIFAAPEAPVAPSYEENSLAIVPLDFKRNGAYDKTLSSSATEFMVNLLSTKSNTSGVKVLPTREVVVKLVDGGFNYEKLRQSSPQALRKMLGTEYLMYVNIDENEAGSAGDSDNAQMERSIRITIFDAANEEKFYMTDLTEDMSTLKTDTNITSLASGKWKSSLRYLAEQLFASNLFSE